MQCDNFHLRMGSMQYKSLFREGIKPGEESQRLPRVINILFLQRITRSFLFSVLLIAEGWE